jgi:hypothetical protein
MIQLALDDHKRDASRDISTAWACRSWWGAKRGAPRPPQRRGAAQRGSRPARTAIDHKRQTAAPASPRHRTTGSSRPTPLQPRASPPSPQTSIAGQSAATRQNLRSHACA